MRNEPRTALMRRAIRTPVRLDRDGDGDGGDAIAGVAAMFYDGTAATEYEFWPGSFERILPGAFDEVLREQPIDTAALFNHDANLLLGRASAGTLRLWTSDRGLEFRCTPVDTQVYRDVREHVRAGNVTGCSFSFNIGAEKWEGRDDGTEVFSVTRVAKLYDVGPVVFPAYTETSVALRCEVTTQERDERKRRVRMRRVKAISALGLRMRIDELNRGL